jgi:hypothetical protein
MRDGFPILQRWVPSGHPALACPSATVDQVGSLGTSLFAPRSSRPAVTASRVRAAPPAIPLTRSCPSVPLHFTSRNLQQTPAPCNCQLWDPRGFLCPSMGPDAIEPTGRVRRAGEGTPLTDGGLSMALPGTRPLATPAVDCDPANDACPTRWLHDRIELCASSSANWSWLGCVVYSSH